MVINLIVAAALLLGGGYLLLWLINPDLRRRIEEPKFLFQDRLNEYHQQQGTRPREENNTK